MKQFVTIFLLLVITITTRLFTANVCLSSAPFEGAGTIENPYKLKTKQDLIMLSEISGSQYLAYQYLSSSYVLEPKNGSFIDMENVDFEPIGYAAYERFSGIFDGNGNEIRNLKISRQDAYGSVGLFSRVGSGQSSDVIIGDPRLPAVIRNVSITNADISGGNNVGIVCGSATGAIIENVYVSGKITDSSPQLVSSAGGITGVATTLNLTNCIANAEISAGIAGGLIGTFSTTEISYSYAVGNVRGSFYAGGLIGEMSGNAMIYNCYATGDITGHYEAGGLTGHLNGSPLNYGAFRFDEQDVKVVSGSVNTFGMPITYVKLMQIKLSPQFQSSDTSLHPKLYVKGTGTLLHGQPDIPIRTVLLVENSAYNIKSLEIKDNNLVISYFNTSVPSVAIVKFMDSNQRILGIQIKSVPAYLGITIENIIEPLTIPIGVTSAEVFLCEDLVAIKPILSEKIRITI